MTEKTVAGRGLAAAGFSLFILALAMYFAHAAFQGDTGLVEYMRLTQEEERLETELAGLRAERARMENLTLRLSDSYLDLDLLDERARIVLGHVGENDAVIR
ncbi:FtsB family cell division protein [Rhodovulum sp. DZ06]|uniref:FtsB family cell division protein n=1 Tax=Rhodovulum sp. DZ06 TaxID=3425126 RepID=UPI003D33C9CF